MTTIYQELIRKHQIALERVASEKSKIWWEKYMKGVIPFRGVGIPENRNLLLQWRIENKIDKWQLEKQLELALAFFDEPIAEDKLAGIIYLQNYLYDKFPWNILLTKYEEIYSKELIYDWNLCDWFCVRVLSKTIERNEMKCAEAIAAWRNSKYLWQARSSVVSFVKLAAKSQYYPYIRKACETLIYRDERFSKTAVGWILRNISKHDIKFVISFIKEHLEYFTKETLCNALKYFEDEKRKYLKKGIK